jgi:hypothetical protein
VGLLNTKRRKGFLESQGKEGDNLYTRIYELLIKKEYAEAEQVLDEHFLRDPLSGEAMLSWAELMLYQGEPEIVIYRIEELIRGSPENPNYRLAEALLIAETTKRDEELFELDLVRVADFAEDYYPDVLGDVFAKIGFNATARGMWSFGMFNFIEAIRVKEELSSGVDPLILLWPKNEESLDLYWKKGWAMQGRVLGYSFADVPLELVVQTVCILLIAYEDLGICEAWPIATMLGHSRRETRDAWENLTSLFSRFCFDWIQIRRRDGERPFGPWSAN